jgi:hypothetical protein
MQQTFEIAKKLGWNLDDSLSDEKNFRGLVAWIRSKGGDFGLMTEKENNELYYSLVFTYKHTIGHLNFYSNQFDGFVAGAMYVLKLMKEEA